MVSRTGPRSSPGTTTTGATPCDNGFDWGHLCSAAGRDRRPGSTCRGRRQSSRPERPDRRRHPGRPASGQSDDTRRSSIASPARPGCPGSGSRRRLGAPGHPHHRLLCDVPHHGRADGSDVHVHRHDAASMADAFPEEILAIVGGGDLTYAGGLLPARDTSV